MTERNTGGPAFPMTGFETRNGQNFQAVYQHGMTLRDYFAAKAMQGFCAGGGTNTQDIAKAAYIVADAMLEARK